MAEDKGIDKEKGEDTKLKDQDSNKFNGTGNDQEKEDGREEEKKKKHNGPPGGLDQTPIPSHYVGFTLKFTFHRAKNLPMADYTTLSSDPYIAAELKTSVPKRHDKEDPIMVWRTPTVHHNTDPEWNCEWIVANVPSSGFRLKARLYDEDPNDYDDRLGNIHVNVDSIHENWEGIKEQSYSLKKRMGSKRAYLIRSCASMFNRDIHMSGEVTISVEMLGKSPAEYKGRVYTVGPCHWSQHYSPLIGRIAGTKDPEEKKSEKTVEKYDFQANQIQLQGPVPEQLYHRYVEFRPFVKGMFTGHTIRGWVLNHALHHQHSRIYSFDKKTVYGSFPSPSKEMTLKFLDLVHYDQGGRIYTYVLTLDGQWRFTETGKEFGIDLLSKHTMHSDVSIYIAWSGEFFVRRLKNKYKDPEEQETHPPADIGSGAPKDEPPKDPPYYQLVIDNDSGTYRPNAGLLPILKKFLKRNLPGMKITTLDCGADSEKMEKMKNEQRERRKEGGNRAYAQHDAGSISSSDEEAVDTVEGQGKERGKLSQLGHDIKQPEKKIVDWAEGGGKKEREKREGDDDRAVGGWG